jgi:hypothetical protein
MTVREAVQPVDACMQHCSILSMGSQERLQRCSTCRVRKLEGSSSKGKEMKINDAAVEFIHALY